MYTKKIFGLLGVLALAAGMASAAVVALPSNAGTVIFTATVSSQANVNLPTAVQFNVTDINSVTTATPATGVPVTINNIVLPDGKGIKLYLSANASAFAPPAGAAATWTPINVSWLAGSWTGGSGNGTIMDSTGIKSLVATSGLNVAALSTTGLVFKLAANSAINIAGDYTLGATWKIEIY